LPSILGIVLFNMKAVAQCVIVKVVFSLSKTSH
jgi:hypothetical protein